MNLLAISINHHTAPVELREEVHLSTEEIKNYIDGLKEKYFSEGFIISTCNRTELFGIPKEAATSYRELESFLVENKAVQNLTDEHFQKFFSCSALNHLFKVISGIDSLLIGDNQIMGQVKEAFQLAQDKQFTGFLINRVIDSAIRVGKRAKTETTINDGAITVSYAAVQLIEKIFSNLSKKSALVIGMGETGKIAAQHLHDKHIGKLSITNRTIEKAEAIVAEIDAQILPFERFKDHLAEFDIIISATSSPDLILTKDEVKTMMKKRGNNATVFMDIALPRDIDSGVRSIDNIFYNDIDSLNIIVEHNMKKRKDEIPKVQAIIMEELVAFFGWYNSLEVAPTIKSLRDYFEEIRTSEVAGYKNKFSKEDQEKLELVTKRIINKLLHHPTTELRKASEAGSNSSDSATKMGLIRDLFGIEKSNSPEE